MICPRCGVPNLPGNLRCARCQADFAAEEPPKPADFYPPRGRERGIVQGLARRREPVSRRRVSELFGVSTVYLGILSRALPSLLPGAGQAISRRWRAAATFAGTALLFVAVLLVGYRLPVSDFALFLLPTVAASSFFDQASFLLRRWTGRPASGHELLGLGLLSVGALFTAVFAVQLAFALEFIRGVVPTAVGPFVRGDRVLARRTSSRLADPQPGEWWIVDRGGEETERIDQRRFTRGGESIVRIVAGPLEEIVVDAATVRRPDGTEFEAFGPRPVVDLPPGEMEIPEGQWVAAEVRWIGNQPHPAFTLVTRDELAGRIVAVTQPAGRRRLVGRES